MIPIRKGMHLKIRKDHQIEGELKVTLDALLGSDLSSAGDLLPILTVREVTSTVAKLSALGGKPWSTIDVPLGLITPVNFEIFEG